MPTPPRPTARPGADWSGSTGVIAARFMRAIEPRRPDRVEDDDRRHVQRLGQRLADGDGAAMEPVEILRRIGAEAGRPVVDQAFGMGEPVLEGEAVDERLQRRARRAERPRHVDMSGAVILEQAGRSDRGENVAAAVIGDDDGDGEFRSELGGAVPGERFERRLQVAVDGEPVDGQVRLVGDRFLGEVRRQHREGLAPRRHPFGLRRRGGIGVDHAGAGKPVEHAVARRAGGRRVMIGAPGLGRLRQGDEERGLGDGEPRRLLAEIGEARRPHALDIAAIGREHEIGGEDLVLAELRLERPGQQDLAELRQRVLGRVALDETRDLHGEGRAAGDDVTAGKHELSGGAGKRPIVDAAMLAEAPVLVADQHLAGSADRPRALPTGRRQIPSAVVNGRRSLPSLSTTMVEVGILAGSSGAGRDASIWRMRTTPPASAARRRTVAQTAA